MIEELNYLFQRFDAIEWSFKKLLKVSNEVTKYFFQKTYTSD